MGNEQNETEATGAKKWKLSKDCDHTDEFCICDYERFKRGIELGADVRETLDDKGMARRRYKDVNVSEEYL